MPVKDTQQELAFQNKEIEVFDINRQANPFGDNAVLTTAYRKAERIALAVHLVSNVIPDSAPIKHAVRTHAQEVLMHMLSMPQGFHTNTATAFVMLTAKIRSVLSLLDLVHIEGYITLDHLQLIKRAYVDVLTFLSTSTQQGGAHTVQLGTEDLSTTHLHKGQSRTYKGHIKDIQNTNVVKDNESENSNKIESSKKRQTPLAQKKVVGSRRVAILDILSLKPNASLQYISENLPKVGPKTIQRELAQLVEDGVVIKEGERRWTTYAISGE